MKKILFVLFVIFLSVKSVDAKVYYFTDEEYKETSEYVEETKTLEVIKEGDIYKYRNRNYIDIPDFIVITSYDFDFKDVIKSNLSFEELNFKNECDLYTNGYCLLSMNYTNFKSSQLALVKIPENDMYIKVPKEIEVKDYLFNILDYIETNIEEPLEILGDINLYENGIYEVQIKYKMKTVTTKINVNNPDNVKEIEDPETNNQDQGVSNEEKVPEINNSFPTKPNNEKTNSVNITNDNINNNDEYQATNNIQNVPQEDVIEELKEEIKNNIDEKEEKNKDVKIEKKYEKKWIKPILIIVLSLLLLILSKFVFRIK